MKLPEDTDQFWVHQILLEKFNIPSACASGAPWIVTRDARLRGFSLGAITVA